VIKCPNCSAPNLDGTLFCDQCIWDLTGVESVPDEPSAAPMAAPMAAPIAEAMPMEAMALEMPAEAMPMDAGFADSPPLDMAAPAGEAPAFEGYDAQPVEAGLEAPPMEAGLEAPPMEAGLEPPPEDLAAATLPAEAELPPGDQLDVGMPDADVMPIGEQGYPVSGVIPAEAVSQILPGSEPDLALAPAPSQLVAAAAPPAPSETPPASQVKKSGIGPLAAGLPLTGQPKLIVVRGVRTSTEYPLMEGTNFIGRFDELPVDIDLSDQEPSDKIWTSRQHACVTWDGGGVSIEDLNSSNGTYINRNKIGGGEKKQLRNGDYVQVGAVLFQVKM
jgi:hypothetical protein